MLLAFGRPVQPALKRRWPERKDCHPQAQQRDTCVLPRAVHSTACTTLAHYAPEWQQLLVHCHCERHTEGGALLLGASSFKGRCSA
jgi:hypothetical protein